MQSCDVVSYSGPRPKRMQNSGDTGSPNDVKVPAQRQAKQSEKQRKEHTWRQAHRPSAAASSTDDVTTDVCRVAANCQNEQCRSAAEGGVGGQQKGQSSNKIFVKSSKDRVLTSPHPCSYHAAGPGSQSPAMPQSSSVNHQLPQSMYLDSFVLMLTSYI